MNATDELKNEHRVIERVLTTLETAAGRLEEGQPVRPEFFLSATDFIRGFADGCHHQKEEGVLFSRMHDQGMPMDSGPLGVMLAEHELGRQYTRALRSSALELQTEVAGSDVAAAASASNAVVQSARNYVALLRQHILKEDNILFPMADQVIPAELHNEVWEDFEHVEHIETGEGVHEKYLALADELEKEMAY